MNSNPKLIPVFLQRLLLLLSLIVGLAIFLIWLPGEVHTALWVGLIAQCSLVGMFFFFILIALSLLWSVGQHADSYIFMVLNRGGHHFQQLDGIMWLTTYRAQFNPT